VEFSALTDELVDLCSDVIDELDGRAEVEDIHEIVRRGTSVQK